MGRKCIETPDNLWHCPLLGRDIHEWDCHEINMVRIGMLKKEILDTYEYHVDLDKAIGICETCPSMPL